MAATGQGVHFFLKNVTLLALKMKNALLLT